MQNFNRMNITQAVLERLANTPDPRLKQIMQALVQHMHAFAQEVHLTEDEWFKGVQFLTEVGQKCTSTRQEFILLSDVLGLSMLTVAMNNEKPQGCTEATVFGPFFVKNAPQVLNGADIANGAKGNPCEIRCTVCGVDGTRIAGAIVDVWQADDEGLYDVQKPELDHAQARARLTTQSDGSLHFRSVVPEAYPIPTDGPVGKMLLATARHPWRPAHLHFMVSAEGYETLITHVFREGDPYLQTDAVFGVRPSLIKGWKSQSDGSILLEYDFVLNPKAS